MAAQLRHGGIERLADLAGRGSLNGDQQPGGRRRRQAAAPRNLAGGEVCALRFVLRETSSKLNPWKRTKE
jgi:hypothetical protein